MADVVFLPNPLIGVQWEASVEAKVMLDGVGAEVEAIAKGLAPVDTGALRDSISHHPGEGASVEIVADVPYACVFGGNTKVVVATKGSVRIADIREGDEVLTQTGEFHTVLATPRRLAVEKPALVDVTVRWRSDRDHHLTLTQDHRVLTVDRRSHWTAAGDLVPGMQVLQRSKHDVRAGTGREWTCTWCGVRFRNRNRNARRQHQFCSGEHRVAWLRSDQNPHLGMKRTSEARANMRASQIARLEASPESHPSRIVATRGYRTSIEQAVEDWLLEREVKFDRQHPAGRYVVDFWLPTEQTVIEADGAYWHQDQHRDIRRDTALLRHFGDVRIIHLHFFDPRFSPELDRNPLPGVDYIACNPGPDTFWEPEAFEVAEVLSVSPWMYQRNPGHKSKVLYDLTVDAVHSFVASGIIVANSFVEFGTSKMPAEPYLAQALEAGIR